MKDLAQDTLLLIIGVGVLVILILVLVIVIWHENHTQHERIAKSIAELPPSPEGTERIIGIVEAQQEMTRQHVSSTVGSIAHETEMNKGLLHKLVTLYDALVAMLIKAVTLKPSVDAKVDIKKDKNS